jgi:hypothetical protein
MKNILKIIYLKLSMLLGKKFNPLKENYRSKGKIADLKREGGYVTPPPFSYGIATITQSHSALRRPVGTSPQLSFFCKNPSPSTLQESSSIREMHFIC